MSDMPWLNQYPPEIPTSIDYSEMPIQSHLKRTASQFPNKTAIHFMGKDMKYGQLYQYSKRFAAYLQSIGLKKGDRVAIMLPNIPAAVISFFGILMAGGIVVQTNPLYTERELQYQMKDSGSKMIITLDILFPRVSKVKPQTELEQIIVAAIKDFLPFPKNLIYPFIQKRQYDMIVKVKHNGSNHLLKEILKQQDEDIFEYKVNYFKDLALLQYTGGTTGSPKGVMLTHENLVTNTTMCAKWIHKAKPAKEVILGVLPFFHVYGMTTVMMLSVLNAHKMVLVPKFEIETILKAIEKQRPTLFPGAPTMYIGLLNHPDLQKYDLSSIEACISGSAALPVEVQQKFEEITGGRLVEGYGLTESSPVTHANFLWAKRRVTGSIGVPFPDTDSMIISLENGEPLPPGEIGEICVKGPQVMKGYWNRPKETEEVLKDGWLYTGDLGYMDEEGYFYVVDRKKDMIIAGGFNIYPREIEEVLYEHPAVKEAVVVGIPDEYRGETVKAYIVLKEGHSVTESDLDQFARNNLAAYKIPKSYEFRDELPKTVIGKILRRALLEEERTRAANEK